jgi:hypothetical protein
MVALLDFVRPRDELFLRVVTIGSPLLLYENLHSGVDPFRTFEEIRDELPDGPFYLLRTNILLVTSTTLVVIAALAFVIMVKLLTLSSGVRTHNHPAIPTANLAAQLPAPRQMLPLRRTIRKQHGPRL